VQESQEDGETDERVFFSRSTFHSSAIFFMAGKRILIVDCLLE
jgi:hypothetical protein